MSRRGFTLVEIVVSLGVFLLGFVSVMSLFLGGYRTQETARIRVVESIIADNLFAVLNEPELGGLKTFLSNVTGPKASAIQESMHYPGYSYFYTVEPIGPSGGEKRTLLLTIYVFETKYRSTLYEKDYSTLSPEEKAEYDRRCVKCFTIIDMKS